MSKRLSDILASTNVQDDILALAKEEPLLILENASLLSGKSFYHDAIKEASYSAISKAPWELLSHTHLYEKASYYPDLIEQLSHTRDGAFYIGLKTNRLHEAQDSERYALINTLPATGLYEVITQSQSELYLSSYNSVLDRLFHRVDRENHTLETLIINAEHANLYAPIFMESAASYNRLDEVIERIPERAYKTLVDLMVEGAVSSPHFNHTIALTEFATHPALADNVKFNALLSPKIRGAFEQAQDAESRDKMGLVAAIWASEHPNAISTEDKAFYLGIQANARYQMRTIDELSLSDIAEQTDTRPQHNQLYSFYDDQDGHDSYRSFMRRYQNNENWDIKDHESYVTIASQNGATNVTIYADKPSRDAGMEAIKAAHPDMPLHALIHRGHSYHANKSIQHITADSKLVFLGSCGSYQEINDVLERSPNAHIISTKGVGTHHVNDPLLYHINEQIRLGEDLEWSTIWKEGVSVLGSKHAPEYIAPDKNRGALMQRHYNALQAEPAVQENTILQLKSNPQEIEVSLLPPIQSDPNDALPARR